MSITQYVRTVSQITWSVDGRGYTVTCTDGMQVTTKRRSRAVIKLSKSNFVGRDVVLEVNGAGLLVNIDFAPPAPAADIIAWAKCPNCDAEFKVMANGSDTVDKLARTYSTHECEARK